MDFAHTFDNGVKINKNHIIPEQFERYAKRNVHEYDEEDIFVDAIRRLPLDAVFLNIGTAVGYYAILAKSLRPDLFIHCFEPLKDHRDRFLDNIALNAMHPDDFTLHSFAVADTPGYAPFRESGFGSMLLDGVVNNENPRVRCILLEDAIQLTGRKTANLVQMDVQGSEHLILNGFFGRKTKGHSLCVENFLIGTHGLETHGRCVRILRENGYKIMKNLADSQNQPDGVVFATLH